MTTVKKQIFIVDDHTLVREWLGNLLRQEADFDVCGSAASAPEALSGIVESRPEVAVVDLSLKGGSGIDLIKDLKRVSPATVVVVLSMHEEIYYVERAFRAGARGYVTKHESTAGIVDAIRTVLDGRIYAAPGILAQLTERVLTKGSAEPIAGVESLSDREIEVFRRIGEGQSTRRIAEEMGLSMKTVQAYAARIKDKLGLANINELLRAAVRWVEGRGTV